jgi:hypothetical protein
MYYDSYNVSSRDDWSFGMTDLKDGPANMVAYGPWRATTPGGGPGVKHASGWMVVMPDGTMGVGSPRESGPWSSWGPELIGGLPFPTDATPSGYGKPNLAFPRTYVQYQQMYGNLNMDGTLQAGKPIIAARRTGDYVFHNVNPSVGYAQPPSEMNPALNNGQGSFTQYDGVGGCMYIETATKQGYLFVGTLGTGHIWYGPAENCGHGLGNPCGGGQGQNATGTKAQWWIYDGAILQQVANGKLTANQVQPSQSLDPQAQISNNIKLGCNHLQTGMYYDKDTNRLFIAAPFADDSAPGVYWPLVHVYQVN